MQKGKGKPASEVQIRNFLISVQINLSHTGTFRRASECSDYKFTYWIILVMPNIMMNAYS